MSRTYLMPIPELTEAEKQERSTLMKQEEIEREDIRKKLWEEQVQKDKTKKFVTLETLLKTRIDPQEDRVVVWADPVALVTEGGIIKPQEAIDRERPLTGTVIAVGPGKSQDNLTNRLLLAILEEAGNEDSPKTVALRAEVERVTIPYLPGDRILYGRFAGTQTQDQDSKTDLLIMRPSDIFAKI